MNEVRPGQWKLAMENSKIVRDIMRDLAALRGESNVHIITKAFETFVFYLGTVKHFLGGRLAYLSDKSQSGHVSLSQRLEEQNEQAPAIGMILMFEGALLGFLTVRDASGSQRS